MEHKSVCSTSRTPKWKGKEPLRKERNTPCGSAVATPSTSDTPNNCGERESSIASDLTTRSKNWADRDDEVMDHDVELIWDDDEDKEPSKGVKIFKIGEKTKKFLATSFTAAAPNATRCQWRDKYSVPSTVATACPNLDKVLMGRLPAATK